MHTLRLFFSWPLGSVWSNLIASVVCVLVAWWRIRAKLITHHAQALAQSARHHKTAMAHAQACHDVLAVNVANALDAHSETVAQALSDHHADVMATLAAVPPANVVNHFHAAPAVAEPAQEPPKRAARGRQP